MDIVILPMGGVAFIITCYEGSFVSMLDSSRMESLKWNKSYLVTYLAILVHLRYRNVLLGMAARRPVIPYTFNGDLSSS
jgi:hypothetical protein